MIPRFDSDMRPHSFSPPRAANGSFHLLSDPDELSSLLPRLLAPQEYSLDDAALDLSVHADERRRLLFVANPTPEHRQARLAFDGRRRFIARWGADDALAEGALQIEVPSYSVQVWEVVDAG
jgi:hypothetical protein